MVLAGVVLDDDLDGSEDLLIPAGTRGKFRP